MIDATSQYSACDSDTKATYPRPKISVAGTLLSAQPKYRNRGVCGLPVVEVMQRMKLLLHTSSWRRESPSFWKNSGSSSFLERTQFLLFFSNALMCSSPFRCIVLLLKDLNNCWSYLDNLSTIDLSIWILLDWTTRCKMHQVNANVQCTIFSITPISLCNLLMNRSS